MKSISLFLIPAVFLVCRSFQCAFASEGSWQNISAGNFDITSVVLQPGDPGVIYIGSNKRVLRSCDGGASWKSLFSAGGRINFLYIAPQEKDSIYAASSRGLYLSRDRGKNWRRIFKGKGQNEDECRSVAVSQKKVYLATGGGLFLNEGAGSSWHKISGLDGQEIFDIIPERANEDSLYASSDRGFFKSQDGGNSWKKIFFVSSAEEEDLTEDAGAKERPRQGVRILASHSEPCSIYLASCKGIYKSLDGAESWRCLSEAGFIGDRIRGLTVSDKGSVYALNSKRVFEYSGEYWEEISPGPGAGELRFLLSAADSVIYLASSGGLFRRSRQAHVRQRKGLEIFEPSGGEPSVRDVQQAAIKYAEVSPEKIARWRRQAALKAWLPQLSAGVQREASDLWHWEGGSTTKCDDDVLRKGRDYVSWDISLSWNLGDILWNNDQTSIDTRSKLMVELRDDILDNVTKLYFERLRLKMEIDELSIEERKKRMDKELRVREVTASLDALTGGYFSRFSSLSSR